MVISNSIRYYLVNSIVLNLLLFKKIVFYKAILDSTFMKQLLSIIPFLFFTFWGFSQDDHRPLIKGNDSYEKENYTKAEEEYLRAIEANPNSVKGHYNRGNAIYKGIQPDGDPEILKQRLDKAAESYLSAIENADDNITKANAYHNLGNTYTEKTEFDKGIEAYKNALRLNPKDMDTKANLQYALRQLQQQQQQEQQEGGEGEQGEGEEKEPQEGQEGQEPQEGQEDQEGQQDQQESEEDQEEKEGGQSQAGKQEDQPTPEEMTKEEVLRQLKVMDEEEKKVQEKLKKEQRSEYKSDKDW